MVEPGLSFRLSRMGSSPAELNHLLATRPYVAAHVRQCGFYVSEFFSGNYVVVHCILSLFFFRQLFKSTIAMYGGNGLISQTKFNL